MAITDRDSGTIVRTVSTADTAIGVITITGTELQSKKEEVRKREAAVVACVSRTRELQPERLPLQMFDAGHEDDFAAESTHPRRTSAGRNAV
jgi:hypothetical protein